MSKRITANDLKVDFFEIDKDSQLYEFSCIPTINSITGKKLIWKTFTSRNDRVPIKNRGAHFAATFDEQGSLVHFGWYEDGFCLSGIYLDQDEEAAIVLSKLTSIAYIRGEISSSSHWGESVSKSKSRKKYRAWVIDWIRNIEKKFSNPKQAK